jgi:lipopolysaccharide heptosyltransferase I
VPLDDRRKDPRVLIIKPSSLGDIVHALPVLTALRARYPFAHLAWLVSRPFAPLLDGHPLLDEVIPFDRQGYGRMLRSPRALADFVRFVRDLRRRRFNLVLDLQGLVRSGFLAWATGAPRRVGFGDARELAWLFYTQRVAGSRRACHAVEMNLRLARAIALDVQTPAFPLGLRTQELTDARRLLDGAACQPLERFTAVLPGARWESKRWRAERFAELIERLHADGFPQCVLLGAAEDRPVADRVIAATHGAAVDLVGRTSLRELAAVLSLAELVICNDSGPMHIAAAFGRPLVALFGPTNPARTGPYDPSARVVQLPLECVPCYRRECPLLHHNCMVQLEVEAVMQAVRTLTPTACATAP